MTETQYVGKVKEKEDYYDLMNAIMVCLGSGQDETDYELLKLLDVLLSPEKNAREKKETQLIKFVALQNATKNT